MLVCFITFNNNKIVIIIFNLFCCFCCPIICADLRGTASVLLIPASISTSSHTKTNSIAALPPEVHRRCQIIGGLSSESLQW